MEKRVLNFMVVSLIVMMAYIYLQRLFLPQPDPGVVNGEAAQVAEADPADTPDAASPEVAADSSPGQSGRSQPGEETATQITAPPKNNLPEEVITIGSADPGSPFRLLAHISNRGGAIERLELSHPRYRSIDYHGAYVGHLKLEQVASGGCRVRVVGGGTPAALATDVSTGNVNGLRVGDVILTANSVALAEASDFDQLLAQHEPGDRITLQVQRPGLATPLDLAVVARRQPVQVICPEAQDEFDAPTRRKSYLMRIETLGELTRQFDELELPTLPSLMHSTWQMKSIGDAQVPGVECRLQLTEDEVAAAGLTGGGLEIVKRFWLDPVPSEAQDDRDYPGYHLRFEVEVINLSANPTNFAYVIDGPAGLPLEGWWYSHKTHPSKMGGAGTRDVVFRVVDGHHEMFTNPTIVDSADSSSVYSLISQKDKTTLQYAGVDAQYFTSALLAAPSEDELSRSQYVLKDARASVVGKVDQLRESRTDVSFSVITRTFAIGPGEDRKLQQDYQIFAGPKRPDLLAHYTLQECVVYGWFKFVARPMTWLLHIFHTVVRNYGLAIVLLTVLVRSLMIPLGRQQAQSAQKMQELAPEMKKIAEQYKDDMEKRAAAQRELFRKHNYNPLSGCLMMFIQLPIFIGLYRALSVDIELRQAALIPGLEWCSNLAGPDKLFYWRNFMPEFLGGYTGWLGPYFNILPLFSVSLFQIQQKLFTPPPTDEQQEMQQRVMKFMSLFIGVLFFKVPAGLCIYFISSGLWSIGERKLLPKPGLQPGGTSTTTSANTGKTSGQRAADLSKAGSEKVDQLKKMLGIASSTDNGSTPEEKAKRRKARRKR